MVVLIIVKKEVRQYIEKQINQLEYSVPYRPKTNAIEIILAMKQIYLGLKSLY